jgi:cysteine-rich repeat protein
MDCDPPKSCGNMVCETDLNENDNNCSEDCDPDCGNGAVEAGEGCDDGAESAACNADCSPSVCMDNKLNVTAGEECDDGNDVNEDECVMMCKDAKCGDGYVLNGVEECDDGNKTEGDECTNACTLPPVRVVFLTSMAYTGNLGGLAGADVKCNERAAAVQLKGSFKAWLSDSTNNPADRFDNTNFTGNYKLVDGTTVANGWMDLINGSLDHAIDMDETGGGMKAENTWSNTGEPGTLASVNHCNDWKSNSPGLEGRTGFSMAVNAEWTNKSVSTCETTRRLYCFEDVM